MKALLLDPNAGTVTPIDIEKGIEAIYAALECRTFAVPITFPNGDAMYVDDEAAITFENGAELGRTYSREWAYPIYGKIIIIGADEEGNSADNASSPAEITARYFHSPYGHKNFYKYRS